jgi:methionyl-tRNA formyltransferase
MKRICLLVSGELGFELLYNYYTKNLKADAIIIDSKSSKLYRKKIKKLKISSKIFYATNTQFSKKIITYLKQNDVLILSFIWPYIIKNDYLKLVKYGVVNAHAGYLPYERGVHSYVYSILRNHPKGVTIHFMNNLVDGGRIIKQKKIKTDKFITGAELEIKLKQELVKLFTNLFSMLVRGSYNKNKLKKVNTKNFVQNYRKNLDMNTIVDLNKKYTAKNLLNLILSRSGFDKGGAHFVYKNKNYELNLQVRKKLKFFN